MNPLRRAAELLRTMMDADRAGVVSHKEVITLAATLDQLADVQPVAHPLWPSNKQIDWIVNTLNAEHEELLGDNSECKSSYLSDAANMIATMAYVAALYALPQTAPDGPSFSESPATKRDV